MVLKIYINIEIYNPIKNHQILAKNKIIVKIFYLLSNFSMKEIISISKKNEGKISLTI